MSQPHACAGARTGPGPWPPEFRPRFSEAAPLAAVTCHDLSMPDPDELAELEARWIQAARAISQLRRSWPTTFSVASEDDHHFRACYPFALHALNQVDAALTLIDAGITYPAVVNVRVAFEHAVTSQWVRLTADGPARLLAAVERHHVNAVRDMNTWSNEVPDELLEQVGAQRVDPSLPAFWEICDRFDGSTKQLYTVYRALSSAVHVSLDTVGRHLHFDASGNIGHVSTVSVRPPPVDFTLALGWSAVMAAHTVAQLQNGRPRLDSVLAVALDAKLLADLAWEDHQPDRQPHRQRIDG